MQDQVNLSVELRWNTLCDSIFMDRVVEEARHSWVEAREWTTEPREFLPELEAMDDIEIVARKKEMGMKGCVFYYHDSIVQLGLWQTSAALRVGGDKRDVEGVERLAKRLLPPADSDTKVLVSFWYWNSGTCSASRTNRLLTVPTWDDIRLNYPSETRRLVQDLIVHGIDRDAGQILLWYGEPGCGKTYAIRALMREWKRKDIYYYISDTEKFFGNSDYMLSVLLAADGDLPTVLILEDAGEFLVPDARQQMGQGLSRLLNVSDGLIGQGLRCTFLITTNEPVGELHGAVSRPGRCAAHIEFGEFSPDEAHAWLSRRGLRRESIGRSLRLADLYAVERGESLQSSRVKVGF